jgi:PPK2 family polyphosphate:nucleotide phosphotransferase
VTSTELIKRARRLARHFRVTDGDAFELDSIDPAETLDFDDEDKPQAKEALAESVAALTEMQELLYAQDRWAVLLIFQAMDAAGKDGAIKHVLSGVNPQGCQVVSFKAPSAEELDHDFLWRCATRLPERGRIGIFNRSYYEEVLVVRVHEEVLKSQKLPASLVTKAIWKERFEDIRHFERYLTRQGVAICKFFLHVSKKEQKKRFLERIDDPAKNWKFAPGDVVERRHWSEYANAYAEMIRNTAAEHAPWYVVPADNKWFTRLVIGAAILDTMASLDLALPALDDTARAKLTAARKSLENESD